MTNNLPSLIDQIDPDTPNPTASLLITQPSVAITMHKSPATLPSQSSSSLLIDPSLILFPVEQISLAVTRATLAKYRNSMKTKDFWSEVLFNLSPANNINDGYRLFAGKPNATVVLVRFADEKKWAGEEINLEKIGDFNNLELFRKVFKIDPNIDREDILAQVLDAMALKGHL